MCLSVIFWEKLPLFDSKVKNRRKIIHKAVADLLQREVKGKGIYAYLIIWEGVNDVPDQIDLQSP